MSPFSVILLVRLKLKQKGQSLINLNKLNQSVFVEDLGLTCNSLEQSADVKYALLQNALKTQAEDGDAGHEPQHKRPCCQKQHGSLPESTGNFPKSPSVRSTAHPDDAKAAAVEAKRRSVFPGVHSGPVHFRVWMRRSQQPIGAHEGDEFREGHHNTEQSPQHGAARHNDMTHGVWSQTL